MSGFAGRGLLGKGDAFDPENWVELPVPADDPLPLAQWIAGIASGEHVTWTSRPAIELTRLVEAANAAAGRTLDYPAPLLIARNEGP